MNDFVVTEVQISTPVLGLNLILKLVSKETSPAQVCFNDINEIVNPDKFWIIQK